MAGRHTTQHQTAYYSFNRSHPDWALYSDAAFEEGADGARMAALLFCTRGLGLNPELPAGVLISSNPGPEEVAFFNETSTIFGIELTAAVHAIFHQRERLRNSAVTLYMDNNAALAALINGDSSDKSAFYLVALFWFLSDKYNIAIWIERVESKRNIADLPTRGGVKPPPLSRAHDSPFPKLDDALAYYTKHLAPHAPSLGKQNELH